MHQVLYYSLNDHTGLEVTMSTLTEFLNPLHTESGKNSCYEIIENEALTDCNLSKLSISGSLFSLSVFKNVTFSSCDFFGSKMENCQFIGCNFQNCKFQFSSIEYSDFHSSTFENCIWDISPIKKSLFSRCAIDTKTLYFIAQGENKIFNLQNNQFLLAA